MIKNPMPAGRYAEVLARDQTCQASAYGLPVDGRHDGGMPHLIVHHRKPKGSGGSSDPAIHDADNLVVLCVLCHLHVHGNPAESYALGLMVRR